MRERETTIQQEKETRGLTEGREGGRKAGLEGHTEAAFSQSL